MGRQRKAGTDERAMLQELAEAITQQLARGRSAKRIVDELGLLGFSEPDARRLVQTVAHSLPRAPRARRAGPTPAPVRLPASPTGWGRTTAGVLLAAAGGTIGYACLHAGQPPQYLVIPGIAVVAGLVEAYLGLRLGPAPA